ncbi:uncharacterized protein zgc:193505 [Chanodichthys erythropterus]|uniref:uncharacterized protein zgc:193505 n=1 Tax=Chanodichthys erythropterus TaxID=933992 RepID=UPI00351F19B9
MAQQPNKTSCIFGFRTLTHTHALASTTSTTADSRNMSFLKGFMGNKAADSFVDQAVDKAAAAAKRKVKETITGKKQENDKTGGMGGLFPSNEEKDKKPKEKAGGGIFGGLLSAEKPEENSTGGAISAEGSSNAESNIGADSNFNEALDDLANEFLEK